MLMNVAQDGSPGFVQGRPTSPVGTTEISHQVLDLVNFEEWGRKPGTTSRVLFSRPFGTGLFSDPYPGLRPGLVSVVPAGLVELSFTCSRPLGLAFHTCGRRGLRFHTVTDRDRFSP